MDKRKPNICIRAEGMPTQDVIAVQHQLEDWINIGYSMTAIMYFFGQNHKVSMTQENERTILNFSK